ncbi:MAG: hypothetical protein ABJF50_17610 [Paracoccaceae bacterium]
MRRIAFLSAVFLAGPAFAQTLVSEPNGTVTGVFLGKEIAFDVLCETNPMFENAAAVTTHTPLSQSLIDSVKEDALSINMFNNGASFIANIDGETYLAVDTEFGAPKFPISTSGDAFDIVIECPSGS